MTYEPRRVVITGLGAITPVGLDAEQTWQNLVRGVSGVTRITRFEPDGLPVQIAAEVKGFEPERYIDPKAARRMARFIQLAVASARMAIEDAGLTEPPADPFRYGVVMNTGGGGVAEIYDEALVFAERGPGRVSPFFAPSMISNMASCQVAMTFGYKGPVITSVAACASSMQSFVDAYYLIQRGDADVVIAGGTESAVSPLAIVALARTGAMSKRNDAPQQASRPFDRDRDGFVFGEGAGAFVLEAEEHARARGARIYAELAGGAITCDAYHVTAPEPTGEAAAAAIRRALEVARVRPEEVDYICAHGTATPLNDVSETRTIKLVFGKHAYRLAISSNKSMVGHLMGGAGAVSGLACVMAIRDGIISPTINLDNPDPECDLDYVPNVARRAEVRVTVANGFGFGGQNAVVVFRKYGV